MAEPIATSEPGIGAETGEATERFERPSALPEAVEPVASEPVAPEFVTPATAEPAAAAVETVSAVGLAPLAEPETTAGAPEWPLAWLKLVEAEAPEVGATPATASADEPSEPAKPDGEEEPGGAHAFSKAMAAALDEPEGAGEKRAANDQELFDPVSLWTKPKKEPEPEPEPKAEPEPQAEPEQAKDTAKEKVDDEEKPEPPARKPRNAAARKAKADKAAMEARAGQIGRAAAVYLLYLAGFLVVPAIGGLLLALEGRRNAPEWLESHYVFQIRTFWIGLAGSVIGLALLMSGALTLVGLVLGLLLVVWLVVRSALGFINLVKLRPYPYPRAWLI